jgi:UDP-galactopyranose mutase
MKPEDLDPAVTGRVPVYISRDDRYFQDKYQGIPLQGYSKVIEKMLDHPNIKVHLNAKFEDVKKTIEYDRLFYTGPIDEFFGYELGELPYRSLKFDFVEFDKPYFQEGACINYPNNYDFTRIGEYKYFLDDKSDKTVVSFEYPQPFENGKNERYYPIVKDENQALYDQYLEKAKALPNVYFLGRLGDYKYYDMDKSIARALELFERMKND